jgi:hypothetical protein
LVRSGPGVNARPGDIFQIGNFQTIISDVTDTLHLGIPPWGGGLQSAVAYKIFQVSPQRFAGAQAMQSVNDLVGALNSLGPIFNVATGATAPDPSLGNDGQYAHQMVTDIWWIKTGGVWVVSASLRPSLTGVNSFTNATEATGVGTTAAALFAGGVEIAKKLFVTGTVSLASTLAVASTTASTLPTNGALTVGGGVGIGGALNVGGTFSLQNATSSSAINTVDVSQNWSSSSAQNLLASFTSYGDSSRFTIRRADGTIASPTQVLSGEALGNLQFRGYPSTGGWAGAANAAQIIAVAAENFTSTQQGAHLQFSNTLTGGTAIQIGLKLWGSGGVSVISNTDPGAGIFGVYGSSIISGGLSVGTTQAPVAGHIFINNTLYLMRNKSSWNNGAGVVTATLNNSPSAGNPTKWIPVDDNGTTRYIPAW